MTIVGSASSEIANLLRASLEMQDTISKSFNQVNNYGMHRDGRIGTAAIHKDRSSNYFKICMEQRDLFLLNDIEDENCKDIYYAYEVKTQNGDLHADYAINENMIGKTAKPNYGGFAMNLKTYGGKTSISHMMKLVNDGGEAFSVDVEDDQYESLMMSISKSQEHDASFGLDYHLDASGDFEDLIFNTNVVNTNRRLNLRHARGLQAYVRAHNFSSRTVSPEKAGYGNIQSVVHDLAGSVPDQAAIDRFLEPIIDSSGDVAEVLCTTAQSRAFREQFIPYQRGNIGTGFNINGPKVDGSPDRKGFEIDTINGTLRFTPLRYRKLQMRKPVQMQINNTGSLPATPGLPTLGAVASQGTSFVAGQDVIIRVQAVNIDGVSTLSPAATHTITADGEGISISIPSHANAEKFYIYATPASASPSDTDLWFVGQVIAANAGATTTVHKEAVKAGHESMLFVPPKDFKMGKAKTFFRAVLGGSSMYELDLAQIGVHFERALLSYFEFICVYGRTYSVVDNVGQELTNARSGKDLYFN